MMGRDTPTLVERSVEWHWDGIHPAPFSEIATNPIQMIAYPC